MRPSAPEWISTIWSEGWTRHLGAGVSRPRPKGLEGLYLIRHSPSEPGETFLLRRRRLHLQSGGSHCRRQPLPEAAAPHTYSRLDQILPGVGLSQNQEGLDCSDVKPTLGFLSSTGSGSAAVGSQPLVRRLMEQTWTKLLICTY